MRLAEATARERQRGPWTKDMADLLEERYGLIKGGPYQCGLLPILREPDLKVSRE